MYDSKAYYYKVLCTKLMTCSLGITHIWLVLTIMARYWLRLLSYLYDYNAKITTIKTLKHEKVRQDIRGNKIVLLVSK